MERRSPAKLGDFRSLVQIVDTHAVERVIIAPGPRRRGGDGDDPGHQGPRREGQRGAATARGRGFRVGLRRRQGLWLLGVRLYGLSRSSAALKRATDLIGALVATVGLLPLAANPGGRDEALEPGPGVLRQRRIGRKGAVFEMIKFRSMVSARTPSRRPARPQRGRGRTLQDHDDPRVTRVGRLLRRISLDEMPSC